MRAWVVGGQRHVEVEDCLTMVDALLDGQLNLSEGKRYIEIDCPCCDGKAAHATKAGVRPDNDEYACQTCQGYGHFEIHLPSDTRRY